MQCSLCPFVYHIIAIKKEGIIDAPRISEF